MKEDFLKEEVRCDFSVSSKRKRIWQVEIDLIEQLDSICKKYHLRYFASNGTLLGVIRHQGFVPWDDDVDIVMPRPDYEKLLEVAEKELSHPYFLQHAKNDTEYYRNYSRLRNRNTTAKTKRGWDKNSCHGIFIDIFPLDGCYGNKLLEKWQMLRVKLYGAMANTFVYYDEFSNTWFRKVLYFMAKLYCRNGSLNSLVDKIEKIRCKIPYEAADDVYMICHGGKTVRFPKNYFAESIQMDFEYIKLPVPKEYDEMLKLHYGDYKKLPPVEKRGEHHSIFFDPDKSYTEYRGTLSLEEAEPMFNNY